MRTKKSFSFNEERDAEKVINEGFLNNNIDYGKMYVIAKYFRDKFGYGEIRLERELIKFCKEQDENFNPITEFEILRKWIKSAMKYGLRKIESVDISSKDIEILKTIESSKDRKLLFMTLILSKALKKGNTRRNKNTVKSSTNYYIRYSNFLDIIRLSKLTNVTEIKLANIFYKYPNLFFFYNPERELVRLEFVDKKPDHILTIDKMDNLLDYYILLLQKKKVKKPTSPKCIVCGIELVKRSNRQKTCSVCAKNIIRVRDKERKRLKRSKEAQSVLN